MWVLGLLALWSLFFDGGVVGMHHHAVSRVAAAQVQTAGAAADAPCALCAASTTIEPFPLPTPPAWAAPIVLAFGIVAIAATYGAPRPRVHHWRSRAPPLSDASR